MDKLYSNMREAWYPISLSADLFAGDVVALHLLGEPICLYRTLDNTAVCISDRCPHRSAPLSIGRVVGQNIECAYHGWQYSKQGKATVIPALLPDRDIPSNAKVYTFPIVEQCGLIWIYAGNNENANINNIPLQIHPGNDVGQWATPFAMSFDLDIDHSLMVENLLDPAHIPFTHDGTIGNRKNACPISMLFEVEDIKDWIFNEKNKNDEFPKKDNETLFVLRGNQQSSRGNNYFHFVPPCFVVIRSEFKNGWKCIITVKTTDFLVWQTFYCIPTRPGHMRLIYSNSRDFFTFINYIPGVNYYVTLQSAKIVFQDYELLHGQQARLQQGAKPWHSPIQVDGMPKAYRHWLKRAMNQEYVNIRRDDYHCVLKGQSRISKGPWFSVLITLVCLILKGWKICTNVKEKDIEDLATDSTIPDCSDSKTIDDSWTIPHQRNCDNSAYTWRRDNQLGRSKSFPLLWSVVTIFGGVVLWKVTDMFRI